MSQSVKDFEKTLNAAADLSAKQFFIAKVDTSGNADLAALATNALIGVIQNKPQSGEGALIRFGGTSKVKLGGTVTAGAWCTSDTAGKGVATTTDKDTVIGRFLEAGVSGDVVEVQLGIFTLSAT